MSEPSAAKSRRGLKIVAWGLVAVLVALLGLFAYARIALAPETFEVVDIKTLDGYQDPALLARAWALPVARTYGPDGLQYQARASFCGPTSLANVDSSLGNHRDALDILDGTGYCWSGQCLPGLTLDELAEIARERTGREVTVLRDLDLDTFREHMRQSNDPTLRYTINFLRGPLFRTGGGHHSPIGGYLEDEDLVFVLDVNAEFGPWLVPTERLFAAMDTIDGSSEQKRGLLRIE